MRRKYFGLAMAAVATLGPAQAFGGDREIAQSIIERLKVSRDAGDLKGFSLDMKVDEGVVLFRGKVSGDQQRALVLATSEGIDGVRDIVDELEVASTEVVTTKPAKIYKPKTAAIAIAPEQSAPAQENGFDFAEALAEDKQASPAPAMSLPAEMIAEATAEPVETVSNVELAVTNPVENIAPVSVPAPVNIPAPVTVPAPKVAAQEVAAQEVVPGTVLPAAAFEDDAVNLATPLPQPVVNAEAQPQPMAPAQVNDEQLTASVVRAIGRAQSEGHLKNFGVDVNAYNGVIELEGKAASNQQREFIEMVAQHAPGARGVRNMIEVTAPSNGGVPARQVGHRTSMPTLAPAMPQHAQGLQPMPRHMQAGVPARPASYGGQQMINGEMVVPGSIVNHGPTMGGQVVGGGAPMMGQPVPMAPAAPAGAPRYDSPNLPNYAWPGYAAHPNYAALSYPQQYSPSAFPFIGPFYPYPQVPLGWRKVSLEWDDGWWQLDFTDK
ncbi:osmotically-inducible protein OsmY [Rhodopirellula rubra]|uniref:Osmotically-inducible protein OsmY n=1 Tax=Aporhodopirellula rubra TaxID=980271 RepID=A0A7W5H6D3_9BACT|nr:BON domain-containing protein [Aporhodopirellula rubra]MBB3208432.1 osmotically-inducible protein OsmY [Aporhodopirellula rubra]